MLPAQRTDTNLESELKYLLLASHRSALFEGRHWDVADVMAAIWPSVRDAVTVRSLVTEGGSDE